MPFVAKEENVLPLTGACLWEKFNQYRKTHDLLGLRGVKTVPADLKMCVKVFHQACTAQLQDPENESWDSLNSVELANALDVVKSYLLPAPVLAKKGNCARCAGTGFILAFSHIKGGECLKCGGSGK